MKIIDKNILDVNSGVILHGCNAQFAMKSGVALQLRDKYPNIYDEYRQMCSKFKHDFERLGQYCKVWVDKDLFVINIISQLYYGYDGQRYSDYSAINSAFKGIAHDFALSPKTQFYLPYRIFCDRGGADWNIVSKMIDYYLPSAIICKLP